MTRLVNLDSCQMRERLSTVFLAAAKSMHSARVERARGGAARTEIQTSSRFPTGYKISLLTHKIKKTYYSIITEVQQNVKFLFSRVNFFMTNNFSPNPVFA